MNHFSVLTATIQDGLEFDDMNVQDLDADILLINNVLSALSVESEDANEEGTDYIGIQSAIDVQVDDEEVSMAIKVDLADKDEDKFVLRMSKLFLVCESSHL